MILKCLKRILSERSKQELLTEVTTLFLKFPQVKEYYTLQLCSDGQEEILNKYKEKIRNEFFPKQGYGKARLSIAKKSISDFKKISQEPLLTIDLMLFYVDQGVEYTASYGDIDGPFYLSMEKMYLNALKLAYQSKLLVAFEKKSNHIAQNACEGWGFKDQLSEIYYEFYDTEIT